MLGKRVQKSSERSPQLQQPAIAPVVAQSHSPSPHIQRDTENQEIQQHKHEATTLEIQAKCGNITPQGQERLTFLQTKMADYTQRKLDFGNRVYQQMFNSSAGDVSVASPKRNTAPPIQAKLTIGQPWDKYEQEADRVAARVVKRIHAPAPQHSGQTQPLQRQALPEQELQTKPMLQLRGGGGGMTDPPDYETAISTPPDYETAINQAKGSGQPMADSIREPMEQAFGADFKGVKIHTDAQSHQLNQSIQARAFTTGKHVFFRQGEYKPESRDGKNLLAHELTHTLQQGGGAVQRAGLIQRAGEVEAAQEVIDRRIRRGNRRGSLEATDYKALTYVDFMQQNLTFIGQRFQDVLSNRVRARMIHPNVANDMRELVRDITVFQGYLAEALQFGNCGDFASVVFNQIMKRTRGQPVYICKLVGSDLNGRPFSHAVNITSSRLGVRYAYQFNEHEATVTDSWYNNKVQTLAQFYAGDNIYRMRLSPENLEIHKSSVSNGSPLSRRQESDLRDVIYESAMDIWDAYGYESEEFTNRVRAGEESTEVFDFPRDNRVHDTRR